MLSFTGFEGRAKRPDRGTDCIKVKGQARTSLVWQGYRLEAASRRISVKAGPTLPAADLFSPSSGYLEREIHTVDDLSRWLDATGTLSYFAATDGHIILGGRASPAGAKLRLEDVAAIYQAHLAQRPQLPEIHRRMRDHAAILTAFEHLVTTRPVRLINVPKAASSTLRMRRPRLVPTTVST